MASKAFKNPIVRNVMTRRFAQTAPAVQKDVKIQFNVLPNKTLVTTLDTNTPVARVTVAFKAGSRYEPPTELGVSHVVRSSAGLTTKNASGFITARKLAQIGAAVNVSGDREFIYYTLEATQNKLEDALECLINMLSNQEFRPWELSDNEPKLKYEIATLSPQVRSIDLLHKAAFRRGLGNSIFISPKRVGKISSESLQHYVSNNVTQNRCAISAIGVSQDRAETFAEYLTLSASGPEKNDASNYFGGELRKEMGGDLAHVALAVKGAAANSPQAIALAVAAKALGNGPVTKWGADHTPLAKAIGNIGPFAAAGFNVSYSDNGLFGVVLTVPKDEADAATKAVAGLLKNPKLSNEAITAGKNQLKLQVLSEAENGFSQAENLAAQALYTGSAKSPADIAKAIDQLSSNDITQVLRSAGQGKISMGAAGNLAFVPYVDEL